ncbi:hypothetical protein BCR41DRAFT_367708 [Lobosporangium transversale]|uniref:Uncharacterized protein n=1 Tax=Lobosporangium transversale TaxID=64571 RepID=A0A1Y2GYL0_9FUNG|nr:hypothetical protein BCR41DRAFT_367708 [Lobosporangium transversale]ORZ27357.1 hypothetical protein BCR41DRAFT_367708 [Lobosporangium transversale]|eukprot:XP_021885084.1 hypothetical protein BCR41DRAFT_367708 [Lobosporangium transversale]
MTCIYSWLQFDDDKLEKTLSHAPVDMHKASFNQGGNVFALKDEEPTLRELHRKWKGHSYCIFQDNSGYCLKVIEGSFTCIQEPPGDILVVTGNRQTLGSFPSLFTL